MASIADVEQVPVQPMVAGSEDAIQTSDPSHDPPNDNVDVGPGPGKMATNVKQLPAQPTVNENAIQTGDPPHDSLIDNVDAGPEPGKTAGKLLGYLEGKTDVLVEYLLGLPAGAQPHPAIGRFEALLSAYDAEGPPESHPDREMWCIASELMRYRSALTTAPDQVPSNILHGLGLFERFNEHHQLPTCAISSENASTSDAELSPSICGGKTQADPSMKVKLEPINEPNCDSLANGNCSYYV
jgi:hypothetical protein